MESLGEGLKKSFEEKDTIFVFLFVDAEVNTLGKKIKNKPFAFMGSGMGLTTNKSKEILKVIRFSENRGVLLTGTTRKN